MEIFLLIALLVAAGIFIGGNLGDDNTPNAPQPIAPSPGIQAMAKAIAKAEGSNPDWNNPGDLTLAFGYPTNGKANSAGVLKFVNSVDGWSALYKQLQLIVSGNSAYYSLDTTLAEFGDGYSGGDVNWAVNVARTLGVSTDATLGSILT